MIKIESKESLFTLIRIKGPLDDRTKFKEKLIEFINDLRVKRDVKVQTSFLNDISIT
jgi:hypothetical protein